VKKRRRDPENMISRDIVGAFKIMMQNYSSAQSELGNQVIKVTEENHE
jgi:hypothetical protein